MTPPQVTPVTVATHPPLRSLAEYLADLVEQYRLLPMTSPARGPLANRIAAVELEIDARAG